jgi:lactaldehyde dehydrogenase / glycolaldehyde dehydrogenase
MSEIKVYQMYINGEFINHVDTLPVINPSDKQIISYIPKGTIEDVDDAVQAAYTAQLSWEKLPAIERAGYLKKNCAKNQRKC